MTLNKVLVQLDFLFPGLCSCTARGIYVYLMNRRDYYFFNFFFFFTGSLPYVLLQSVHKGDHFTCVSVLFESLGHTSLDYLIHETRKGRTRECAILSRVKKKNENHDSSRLRGSVDLFPYLKSLRMFGTESAISIGA